MSELSFVVKHLGAERVLILILIVFLSFLSLVPDTVNLIVNFLFHIFFLDHYKFQ